MLVTKLAGNLKEAGAGHSVARPTIVGIMGLVVQAVSVLVATSAGGVEIVYDVGREDSSNQNGSRSDPDVADDSCEFAPYGAWSTLGWVMGLALVQFLVQEHVSRIRRHKLTRGNAIAVLLILASMAFEGLKACRLALREAAIAWSYVGGCFLGLLAGVIVESLIDCVRGGNSPAEEESTALYVRVYTKWAMVGSSLTSSIAIWFTIGNKWPTLTVIEPLALILGSTVVSNQLGAIAAPGAVANNENPA